MFNQPNNINSRPQSGLSSVPRDMRASTNLFNPAKQTTENKNSGASPGTSQKNSDSKLTVRFLNLMISVSIFMVFFGFPLFFTGLAFQGIVFEKQLYFYFWVLLGLISWTAKGVINGEMKIRRTPLDFPIVGFWLAVLLSTIFSIDRWHGFWGAFSDPSRSLMSVTATIIFYYLILSHFSKKNFKAIITALILSGSIISIWTLLALNNIKFLPDFINKFAPISLAGSIVGVGVFISSFVLLVTLAILLLIEGNKGIARRILVLGLLVILISCLFLISFLYNFIPWVALFAGMAVFLVFILSQVVNLRSNWVWLPMIVFVGIIVVRLIGSVNFSQINLAEIKPLDYASSQAIAIESLKEKPFFGTGPGTYGYSFSLYKPQDFNENFFYNLRFLQGSGVFFETVSTLGGVGMFFLIILLLSFVSVEFYLIARGREKNKLASLGLFAASLVLLISVSMTKVEGTLLILAALLGTVSLAIVLRESESQERYLSLSLVASPKYALTLAFIFMAVSVGVAFLFVFLGKIYIADIYAGAASRAGVNDMDNIMNKMTRAVKYYPWEEKYLVTVSQYYMSGANQEASKGDQKDVTKIQQYLNFSIAAAKKGKEMMPYDVATVEFLAQIYENAGLYVPDSYDLAYESYQEALKLEPHNPNFYLKMGMIKSRMAATKKELEEKKMLAGEAKEMFRQAVEKKKNLAEGFYQLALVEDALGEREAAIENSRRSVEINPKRADYLLALGRLYQSKGGNEDMKIAEQVFKAVVTQNDQNVNGHFYLGVLYEKIGKNVEAKEEYKKVKELLSENSTEIKKQLDKMIANIDAGVKNTPETLGLVAGESVEAAEDNNEPRE